MVDLDAGYKIAQEMKRVSATDTSNDRFNINRENKMSDEILTVKKDNVLAAAKECDEAKRILAKVFPDAFEEKKTYCKIEELECRIATFGDGLFFKIILPGGHRIMSGYDCKEEGGRIWVPFFKGDGFELDEKNFKIKK